jgi:ubiquinone/menaquinone biosynthesis C-methylase UbiE
MKHKIRALLFTVLGLVVVVGSRIYQQRTRERVPSPESMDNPDVAAAFNRIATWPQMRLLRWFVANRIIQMTPKGIVVDIGCGPGHMILSLAKKSPVLEFLGIDLSEEVLAQADASTRKAGFAQRVAYELGGAQNLPLPDESVDMVISSLSLHHWSEPVQVLDEVHRVLRPGGAFLIFDLRRDMAPPLYLGIWFVTRFIVPRALREVNEPMSSRNAAYTPQEAAQIATSSSLSGWRVIPGRLWLTIEGRKLQESQKQESTSGREDL